MRGAWDETMSGVLKARFFAPSLPSGMVRVRRSQIVNIASVKMPLRFMVMTQRHQRRKR